MSPEYAAHIGARAAAAGDKDLAQKGASPRSCEPKGKWTRRRSSPNPKTARPDRSWRFGWRPCWAVGGEEAPVSPSGSSLKQLQAFRAPPGARGARLRAWRIVGAPLAPSLPLGADEWLIQANQNRLALPPRPIDRGTWPSLHGPLPLAEARGRASLSSARAVGFYLYWICSARLHGVLGAIIRGAGPAALSGGKSCPRRVGFARRIELATLGGSIPAGSH